MKEQENNEVYCIFNNDKESINIQIENAFKEYLKDVLKNYKKLE